MTKAHGGELATESRGRRVIGFLLEGGRDPLTSPQPLGVVWRYKGNAVWTRLTQGLFTFPLDTEHPRSPNEGV